MFFKSEIPFIINQFAEKYYPESPLNRPIIEQLEWIQKNSVYTSQSSIQTIDDSVNIEVKRTLARFNCYKLLVEGGSKAYLAFIEAQSSDVVLSETAFNTLSQYIRELSSSSLKCLMATCFITMSDEAIKATPEDLRHNLPVDSEQFITYFVTHHASLLPICRLLDPDEITLLPYAFYKNSHVRHMLDMEGGYNMVSSIAEAIRLRHISYDQYSLWFARWIINIAGLDGHVHYSGSRYLTQGVAEGIFALKDALSQLWVNPSYPVIDDYLRFKATQLKVGNRYVVYLGALMRQYTKEKGEEIQAWYLSLPLDVRRARQEAFDNQLRVTRVTPTFKPVVLVNLLDLKCSVFDALTLFTLIEEQAMALYLSRDMADTPLSYREIAKKGTLSSIVDFFKLHHVLPELAMDSKGYLSVSKEALESQPYAILQL